MFQNHLSMKRGNWVLPCYCMLFRTCSTIAHCKDNSILMHQLCGMTCFEAADPALHLTLLCFMHFDDQSRCIR